MNKMNTEEKTSLLLGLFCTAVVGANLLGGKITRIGPVETSVGLFIYPLTFLITDVVQEVHGPKKARDFVKTAFACVVFILAFTAFAVWLPFAPRSHLRPEQYTPVFGMSLRFFIASVTAFLISQMHDLWAFGFWKRKTSGRWLWLRNNASTTVSQLIDTIVFMFLALYYIPWLPDVINTSPQFNAAFVFTLIVPSYVLKVCVALFDTPFCYLGVRWLRGAGRDAAAGEERFFHDRAVERGPEKAPARKREGA